MAIKDHSGDTAPGRLKTVLRGWPDRGCSPGTAPTRNFLMGSVSVVVGAQRHTGKVQERDATARDRMFQTFLWSEMLSCMHLSESVKQDLYISLIGNFTSKGKKEP